MQWDGLGPASPLCGQNLKRRRNLRAIFTWKEGEIDSGCQAGEVGKEYGLSIDPRDHPAPEELKFSLEVLALAEKRGGGNLRKQSVH